MDVSAAVARLPFYKDLSADEKDDVLRGSYFKSCKRGDVICGAGVECLGMIKVLSGEIRAFLLSEEGREVTLYKVAAGDVCVLSASCVLRHISFDTQMVVSRDCELLIVAAPTFKRVSETNLAVKCYVYEVTTERFSQVMWSMQQILFEKLDVRLARFLLEEADKNGKLVVYMTHDEIARQISSAREVVARMLKIFASDGLVDTAKRGEITIIDRPALESMAK